MSLTRIGERTFPTSTTLSRSSKRHCHIIAIRVRSKIDRKLNIATCINSTALNRDTSASQCKGASKILLVLLGNIESHLVG